MKKSIPSIPSIESIPSIKSITSITSIPSTKNQQKKGATTDSLYKRLAATYFSTNQCSIIGDARLNFSVRNGKR